MRARDVLVTSIAVAIETSALAGGGPVIPERFTVERRAALIDAPAGTFSFEVGRLIATPSDGFTATEVDDHDEQRRAAEAIGLAPDAMQRIEAMRAQPDDESAYAAGDGLSDAVRQYTAGAVAFRAAANARLVLAKSRPEGAPDEIGDAERALLASARGRFEAVLAVARPARHARELWARYMLGRVAARLSERSTAIEHFEATRAMVAAGRPDPLGLAVASYGEQARVHLDDGDVARAVDFYGRQASHGSYGAVASLKRVVRAALADPGLLDASMADPLARRLVCAYVFTHGLEAAVPHEDEFEDDESPEAADGEVVADAPEDAPEGVDPSALMERLADAVERSEVGEAEGADWVAAVAYRDGRFDLARRLLGRSTTPLARIVSAKLRVRDGDMDGALAAYEAAIADLRTMESPPWSLMDETDEIVDAPRRLREIDVSRGVLWLARGDFLRAFAFLLAAGPDYWTDAAYVAERLLTTDELEAYVDEHVPPTPPDAVRVAIEAGEPLPVFHVRALLARRLMREDRFEEALAYFDDADIREKAQEYIDARQAAESRWRSRVDRAEAWYDAATLARFDGMDILGFELAPDFAIVGGQYELDAYFAYESAENTEGLSDEEKAAERLLHHSSEATRFAQHRPSADVRYQYRVTAAELAEQSAELLPRSSQAFAAVLCDGVTWLMDTVPDRAQTMYRRYLREGPYVPWGRDFGDRCPKPDFAGASYRRLEEAIPLPTRVVRPLARRPYAAAGATALVLLAVAIAFRRYRARRS